MSVFSEIEHFNAGRDPIRLQMKLDKMAADPFAFLRGSCHHFYQHLAASGPLKKAPLVWSCGDLHLENFGTYKGDNRQTYFDINDFDEGVLAPATWDLVRMLTSILVAGPSLGLSPKKAEALRDLFIERHALALAGGKAYWVEQRTSAGLIRELLDGVSERSRESFLDKRTTVTHGKRQFTVDGVKAMAPTQAERAQVQRVMKDFAKTQPKPAFFKVLDVAIRVAGTGGLGLDRYAVLVAGKGSLDTQYILDLKASMPSSLLARLKVPQPAWSSEAHRIVATQSLMQAVPMAFLHPVEMGGRPFVLRALQPTEDRLSLAGKGLKQDELAVIITHMAHLLAWAQLRSAGRHGSAIADDLLAFGQATKWRDHMAEASQACAEHGLQSARRFRQQWEKRRALQASK
jgi:uncharacterized protein (DUF2252 family)